jgi:hypothetical protein
MPKEKKEDIYTFKGTGKSKLPTGTKGTLGGTATYVDKGGGVKVRGHFRPGGKGPGTTISMEHLEKD